MPRIALDTNIIVYAEGLGEVSKVSRSIDVVSYLQPGSTIVPVQVLGELTRVLVGKASRSYAEAKISVQTWSEAFVVAPSTQQSLLLALELASSHQMSIWDALIMAVAYENACGFLLSEDLQHGFRWAGVEVVNPFMQEALPF